MAGLPLEYSINDQVAREHFVQLQNINTEPMFDEIGAYLTSETAYRFAEGIGPAGLPTEPSQSAIEEGGVTLVDHGHLRDSYTYETYPNGSGLEHGSNLIYSRIHHFGGEAGRRLAVTLPEWPKAGINAADEDEIQFIVHDFIERNT